MVESHTIKIILAEDDNDLCESLIDCLGLHGFTVTGVPNALAFYQTISSETFDVAIIDIGLPDQSGLEIVRHLKKIDSMGIVILTALVDPEIRIQGYEIGADLYFVKPTKCKELAFAISNLVERIGKHNKKSSDSNDSFWVLSTNELQLSTPAGLQVLLTARETTFLKILITEWGKKVERQTVCRILELSADNCSDRRVDSMIRRLRKKIKDTVGLDLPLQTVYGEGYVFSSPAKVI